MDFQSFLEQAQADGIALDPGEFTLNALKAREKLIRHQLGDSGLWLVKLVQAAVRGEASEVEIKFARREVRVSFSLALPVDAQAVLRAVLAGTLPNDPILFHLVAGLRGSLTTGEETVVWSVGGLRVSVTEEGTSTESLPDSNQFQLVAQRPARSRSFSGLIRGSMRSLLKQTVEEYEAVRRHCWPCPIPVQLDGKELHRGYGETVEYFVPEASAKSVMGSAKNGPQGSLITGGWDGPEHRPLLPYPLTAHAEELPRVRTPFHPGMTFCELPAEGEPTRAVVSLLHSPNARCSVDWVVDGAMVHSAALDLPGKLDRAGLRFVVAAEVDQLDLSHFGIRDADPQAIALELAPRVEQLWTHLEGLRSKFYYLHTSPGATKAIGGLTLGTTGLLCLVSPFIAVVNLGGGVVGAMAGLGWVRSATYRRVRKLIEAFREYRDSAQSDTGLKQS